jgi:hypothetical protein
LEVLNRLGLARLIEARSRMPRTAQGDEPVVQHAVSMDDDLLLLERQVCAEPANGNRVLKRLKSESTQFIYDLARPGLECEPMRN